jgi:hypothetical protein
MNRRRSRPSSNDLGSGAIATPLLPRCRRRRWIVPLFDGATNHVGAPRVAGSGLLHRLERRWGLCDLDSARAGRASGRPAVRAHGFASTTTGTRHQPSSAARGLVVGHGAIVAGVNAPPGVRKTKRSVVSRRCFLSASVDPHDRWA